MRDDILGIFGSPAATGKPNKDLIERKATSVVVAAHQLADGPARRQLHELMAGDRLDEAALDHWRGLDRLHRGRTVDRRTDRESRSAGAKCFETQHDRTSVTVALLNMADLCTQRAA